MTALVPYSRFRAVDDDNEPLVGGLLYSYAPGTSTPKDTYTDHTLGTPNTNPIVLNANGEATVYIDGDTDLTLEDATSVLRWGPIRASDGTTNQTQTNATLSGTLTVSSTAVTWSGNPTHSGNHTFTNNVVVNGNTTLGDSGADSLTINPSTVTWGNSPTHSGTHTWSGVQVYASQQSALVGSAAAPSYSFTGSLGTGAYSPATNEFGVATNGVKALHITSDRRIYGTALHNNAGSVSGTANQYIASGTYSPTATNVSNATSITVQNFQWMRVGNVVAVSGAVLAGATSSGVVTTVRLSIPIASNFASIGQCAGSGWVGGTTPTAVNVEEDSTNDAAILRYVPSSTSTVTIYVHFQYVVL